jgi:nitrite reductase (NADH) large subunit
MRVVVIGNGMVGHRLVEELLTHDIDVVVFGEEPRPAYDRVGLSSFFTGTTAEELCLVPPGAYDGIEVHLGDRITSIDRDAKQVVAASGAVVRYDALVMATGSYPFVPPIPGNDLPHCFVYRTIEDLEAIRDYAAGCRVGAVVGGGLLGLEAANALRLLGLETHVVEFAPRLMPLQVDDGGGSALRAHIEGLGVRVHTSMQTTEITPAAMQFADGEPLPVDMVVFSAGIRPRDELARLCGLEVGERGGVVVDPACRTSDPDIYAVGECALAHGRIWGLVAPGYDMARVAADHIAGGNAAFEGGDLSTKLKLMGVDVASFGETTGDSVTYADEINRVYKRLFVSDGKVKGGILVGDATAYGVFVQMMRGDMPVPDNVEELILGPVAPSSAPICSCNSVSKGAICGAIAEGFTDLPAIKMATKAGTTCGGCVPLVTELLKEELRKAGVEVRNNLCEHFGYSRQELFDIVRIHRIVSFSEVLASHGTGRGCEICKPAVASMLASTNNGYILDGEQAALQDTNDHFLANLQRDGTYSVVPRVPGGEITPDQLIAIGHVAKEFGLYTKITGGQRIDMFGAKVDQLPFIWAKLIEAGMESGHAYGKALRTVKSCVGQTWCRFGVQDSTSMAIRLELRYRGLRAPHKIKSAVSGCVRECAEAQSKDFGVIATERGWNLFVGGNGGARPQHAVLLAEDVDDDTLVRYIDRFLMFYVRTADRLERTATWLNKLDGGIDYLRQVVVEDSLGIAAELEEAMEAHVESYRCEWRETVEDPERLARFRSFVNSDQTDPHVVMVPEREQHRPAFPHEKPIPLEVL